MAPIRRLAPIALAALWVASPALAQERADGEEGPRLEPPELVEFVEAELSADAHAEGEEVVVELELTLDREGRVADVKVTRSGGEAFDRAAVEAARRFVFEPARRDGEPIPAIVPYRYVFEPPEPEPAEAPQRGALSGQVVRLEAGDPVAGARVTAVSRDGTVAREARTDAEGRFRFEALPPGPYRVRVAAEGLEGADERERVAAGEETVLTYRLAREGAAEEPTGAEPTFGAVATAPRPPREVTRRTIGKEELTRIPGTRGDALRAVELLPGVARPPFGAGLLIVRGSAPGDSAVFFDGTTVPLLYHFGGLTSFVNSRLLEQIDFYPGNFSVRYGRKVGGILEVQARDPATDEFHGVADLNVLDASLLAEGPVGENASVAVAARRSHIDAVFKALPGDNLDVVTAPVYWDYQAFAAWRPTSRDRFLFKVYGSSDRFEVVLSDPSDTDPEIRGDVELATQFHFAQVGWERQLGDDVDQDIQLRFGPTFLNFGVGEEIRFGADLYELYGRAEWSARLADRVRLTWGLDLFWTPFDIAFRGPPPRQDEGLPGGNTDPDDNIDVAATGAAFQPALYMESDLRPWDAVRFVLGMRIDYFEEVDEFTFDPRLVALVDVTDDWRLKAGVGVFSQPPDFEESAPETGNPNLDPLHAAHVTAGFEHDLTDHVQLGVEGFYKHLWDVVVSTPGGVPPGFVNDGIGRIYGVEVLGRMTPGGDVPMFGYVSYTLSRSERRDRPGDRWRLFDFDQTHILTLAAVYELPKNWEVGATLRLVSGNPQTPVLMGRKSGNDLTHSPVFGRVNSQRNPLFNRLDLRVEKQWVFDAWKLALYLDVQNVYNAKNPEGTLYNYDFSESEPLRGLPIIPSLGIRGEL
ncbi:MAG: TonB-dependent receptor domain-containing protein [Myxococcota bacterium]